MRAVPKSVLCKEKDGVSVASSMSDDGVEQSAGDRLRRRLRSLLRDQRIRFLMVGATNTVVGYLLYSVLWLTLGSFIGYLGALYGSYVLSSILAFNLYRRFVFNVSGNVPIDFIRFQGVYIIALAINTVALPFAVEILHWSPLVAQFVIVAITTIVSYMGHKFFSFRRKPLPFEPDSD
jgi:putative flippase GtrA